ncbi:UTP--GlnB (protein PII) uridylyltransferase, GlnD [Jatrophihabitans endophyticus]|uniref:Bifunctional uridylyltransferase/uridylyl-removing enzyme n=1 Tax=Jatrophihabitans endophyticus TaxID=1206085 RepID=A0A1M5D036_9ACTN|nr:[protein-PII] uridylyltransferase [Jatrophihabitans endophyticus]SHF60331.1 UTP--GlnB (protein PII) uridylyltransferase, GlnD [Jatrophihabitans endophyticus]
MLRRPGLVGARLRHELSDTVDGWLRPLLADRPGLALVAVGGLGRREPAPYSDLDLVLLHDGGVAGLGDVADAVWYPVWDSGVSLDHSVRTPDQAVAVARTDLKALLGLLDIRHIAGDAGLTGQVRSAVLDVWRATAVKRMPELREISRERWAIAGEAAYLLEPNLKESRGGLRDAQALHALAAAQLVDYPVWVREAYPVLLDVRGELHRLTGRAEDVLRQQEHDGVATALGLTDTDTGVAVEQARDQLLRRVNEAARSIAHAVDVAWRRVGSAPGASRPRRRLFGQRSSGPERIGLAKDVVAQDGEVVLARDADPWADPGLVLRVARAAAENDLPIAPFALERLASESAPLPAPWPSAALGDLLAVLGTGRRAIGVLEALDQAGLLVALIPEWDAVRCRAQRDPVHRYTVDRHLLECAAAAAERDDEVERPDLLVLGALLHDIGKGYPGGDHSVTGAVHAETIARRLGYAGADLDVLVGLVRHHLLLPHTATRRDLDDPMTITIVRESVDDSLDLLDLLLVLTRADAAATGPGAWSEWRGRLVDELVERTRAAIGGRRAPEVSPLDDERRALAEAGALAVVVTGDEVVVAAADTPGTLYRTAGVLALHSLDVREASIATHAGMAVNRFVVHPRFGQLPDPARVRQDLAVAMRGELGLADKLRQKEETYSRRAPGEPRRRPTMLWFDDSADATVLEFRGEDEIGLLSRITAALEAAGLDIRAARVSSLAGVVVDAFYVTDREGKQIPEHDRPGIEAQLRAAWPR